VSSQRFAHGSTTEASRGAFWVSQRQPVYDREQNQQLTLTGEIAFDPR